jgi:mitochondrial fission protein ELM1
VEPAISRSSRSPIPARSDPADRFERPSPPRTWALVDDRPGNLNQVLAVAEAVGWPFAVKTLGYGLGARLPNALLGPSLLGVTSATRAALMPPWPELVIAAGRRSLPAGRWLKRRTPTAFLVQLMWPGSGRGPDLIVAPAHDEVADRPGLIRTQGTPHRITPRRLEAAATALRPRLAGLPRPWIACLVGGSSHKVRFTPADAAALARQASALARGRGGSLLVTTSRRTGPACSRALAGAIDAAHFLHQWSPGGDNPYVGVLGVADALIVTADSASMCTEACATGRPVLLFRPAAGVAPRLDRLHAWLEAQGRLAPIDSAWPAPCPPLRNSAEVVAEAIRARFAGPIGAAPGPAVVPAASTP